VRRKEDSALATFSHVSFFHPCSYYELEAEEYKRRGVNLTPELWLVG